MSYDLQLRKEGDPNNPLTKTELQKLEESFDVKILSEKDNYITGFAAKFKDNQPEWVEDGIEFFWQDEEHYWTYISYSANEEMFEYFNDLTDDVAEALSLSVFNPQFENEKNAIDRDEEKRRSEQKEIQRKQWINKTLNNATNFEFDYRLFIASDDPDKGHSIHLYENGEGVYRDTIRVGEILINNLKPTVKLLTGTDDFEVLSIIKVDPILSQEITHNPLINVTIRVDYFDPKTRNLKYNMVWV